MRLFLFTSVAIDILFLLKFLCEWIIILSLKKIVSGLHVLFHLHSDFNKLNIKIYQLYLKSTKINAFERKICICHNPSYDLLYLYSLTGKEWLFQPLLKKLRKQREKASSRSKSWCRNCAVYTLSQPPCGGKPSACPLSSTGMKVSLEKECQLISLQLYVARDNHKILSSLPWTMGINDKIDLSFKYLTFLIIGACNR